MYRVQLVFRLVTKLVFRFAIEFVIDFCIGRRDRLLCWRYNV